MSALRCVYVDLDGTLLGYGASLLRDGEGAFSLFGVRALEACARADVEVVIYSGRKRAAVFEDARLLGMSAFIFEVGCGLEIEGELEWLTDGIEPNELTIHEQLTAMGAPALLLERYAGRLEYHTPWHVDRDVSHLFRGEVDTDQANALLAEHEMGTLRLVDNGVLRRHPTLPEIDRPHAYHLIPAGTSKARAVARHQQIRGYTREQTIAVGDSREDMGAASEVATFWLVANAVVRDPDLIGDAATLDNVRITEAGHGGGVYEAVVTTLAERR